MKITLSHTLPDHKQAEIKAIREALIPRFTEIEMIILFGGMCGANTWKINTWRTATRMSIKAITIC